MRRGEGLGLDQLDALTVKEWKKIVNRYFVTSAQAAKILGVSIPRVFQYQKTGHLNNIVKGRFLRKEVQELAKRNQIKREYEQKAGEDAEITLAFINKLINQMYKDKGAPLTPQEILLKVEELRPNSTVVLKHRVQNTMRNLEKKGQIERIGFGQYIPKK